MEDRINRGALTKLASITSLSIGYLCNLTKKRRNALLDAAYLLGKTTNSPLHIWREEGLALDRVKAINNWYSSIDAKDNITQ